MNSLCAQFFLVFMLAFQAQPAGTVIGGVLDARSGAFIRNAKVTVEGLPNVQATTDLDGSYRIELPPGKYRLRVVAEGYTDTSLSEVDVLAGRVQTVTTIMSAKGQGTVLDVVEKLASAATAEAVITERMLSPVVSDAMSSEEIRQTVASDAAGVLEKVTGVSIVDAGFVYVRGLGERYSATMLNNAMLPTTEPERRVVPLDMFPASLIDSVKILKSYSVDLPGEFSGGLVQLQTVEFPNAKTLKVGISNSFNTQTTFKPFSTYPGGGRDFLGFDDGTRSLPSAIPAGKRLFTGSFTAAEFQQMGRAFSTNWEPTTKDSMRPAQSYSVSAGNTFGRLGLVGAFSLSNTPEQRKEVQKYYRISGTTPIVFTDYSDFLVATESARMGGAANLAFRLTNSNKLVFRNTLTRDTDKEARRFSGINNGTDPVESTRLRWVERSIYSTSIEGEHAFSRIRNSVIRWQYTHSRSSRKEPDLREHIREPQGDGTSRFQPQSGSRFHNELQDRINEPLIEWATLHSRGAFAAILKLGYRGTYRTRDFAARRFSFLPVGASTGLDFMLPANKLLASANIRPDGFSIREFTRGTDTYDASMDIHGGFAMVDLTLGSHWRVNIGARVEDANIAVKTIDPLAPGAVPRVARLQNRDVLPGLNVVYALSSRQNLRFGYSRTLSRPDFRELSPFTFTNVLGGYDTFGNPDLKRATIDNFDGRWEWFLGGDQVVAASYFRKRFINPIEVTVAATGGAFQQSYVNAKSATNQGLELEWRRSLLFAHERLAPFSVTANLTVVDSNVNLEDSSLLLTSRNRPMVGQSRYISNLIVDWSHPRWGSSARFFVNVVSRRITDVGLDSLPDVYQEGNTFLDFAYQYGFGAERRWSIRLTGENLGNTHRLWTQAGLDQRSYRSGRTFSAGLTFSIF